MATDFEQVTVKLEPHTNAENLSLVRVGDFQVVVRTADWKDGDIAAYIFPDALVDTFVTNGPFGFLRKHPTDAQWQRVKALRLRGERSFGLLVPWRDGLDTIVQHWNPPEPKEADSELTMKDGRKVRLQVPPAPGPSVGKYDLENGRRDWKRDFTPGCDVVVTEKIHGSNAKFCWWEGALRAGGRNSWKKRPTPPTVESLVAAGVDETEAREIAAKRLPSGWYYSASDRFPSIEAFCHSFPGAVLFGEVYGPSVQKGYAYDAGNTIAFRAFDVWQAGAFWDRERTEDALRLFDVPTVPELYRGPFNAEIVEALAEGRSTLNLDTQREGVVVQNAATGVKMKWVGFEYLSSKHR